MSAALKRLLDRTLPDEGTLLSKKREKKSRAARKSKVAKAHERDTLKALINPKHKQAQKVSNRAKNIQALKKWDISVADNDDEAPQHLEERQELYEKILKKRDHKIRTSRKVKSDNKSRSWPGLTPGLAPVGYEPDEED